MIHTNDQFRSRSISGKNELQKAAYLISDEKKVRKSTLVETFHLREISEKNY
jgi:hypothetical protein